MLRCLKLPSVLTISLFCSATLVQADEQLLDGVRPFICDGENIVLLETDDGWVIPNDPEANVRATANGWRYEEPFDGDVWYLREESQNSWVIEGLSEYGHFTVDCIDLADSVSQVVTIIKPRLDEGILDIEKALTLVRQQLAAVLSKNSELQEHNAELIKSAQSLTALLEAEKAKYSALRLAGVKNLSSASFVLRDLVGMGPSERNTTINSSNLLQALNGSGMLPQCVRLLRDKAKLNEKCEETIIDFLLLEGWQ